MRPPNATGRLRTFLQSPDSRGADHPGDTSDDRRPVERAGTASMRQYREPGVSRVLAGIRSASGRSDRCCCGEVCVEPARDRTQRHPVHESISHQRSVHAQPTSENRDTCNATGEPPSNRGTTIYLAAAHLFLGADDSGPRRVLICQKPASWADFLLFRQEEVRWTRHLCPTNGAIAPHANESTSRQVHTARMGPHRWNGLCASLTQQS